MLAWIMNLGFAASGAAAVPEVADGTLLRWIKRG